VTADIAENWTAPGLALQLLGGGLIVDAVRVLPAAWASRRWRQAEGRILAAEYMAAPTGGEGPPLPALGVGLRYDYTVGNRRLEGNRVSFAGYAPTSGGVVAVRRRYPPGAAVTVWYDRNAPENSVLEPGMGVGLWGELAIGLALFLAGSALRRAT